MINYHVGDSIKDERYDEEDFLGYSIENMPYTPNNNWKAPRYNPFMLEELVAVHLTDQDASEGILKPHSYAPLIVKNILSGEETGWFYPRETLHFTLNGFVDDHKGGRIQEHVYSWRNKKFVYIVPLAEIINQTISLFTHDTIVLGKVKLPDSTKIITNQTTDKIKAAIKKRGYRVFDIQGVKELDPAYLEGTDININHPVNFSEILGNYQVDGPYTAPAMNNILMLDGYLEMVFSAAAHNNSLFKPYEKIVSELQKRINYFKKRYKLNRSLTEPLSRLERGVARYISFLRVLKSWEIKRDNSFAGKLSDKQYMALIGRIELERKAINEQLLWKDN